MGILMLGDQDPEVKDLANTGDVTQEESPTAEKTPEETSPSKEEVSAEEPSEEIAETPVEEDADALNAVGALQRERENLLRDISELRAERRKTAKEPIFVEEKPDLSDVSDNDVKLIEKVLKAKGYVHRDEIQKFSYERERDVATDEWIEKHPEYKPENDPNDTKWKALNTVVSQYFKAPQNPREVKKILDLASGMVSPVAFPTKSAASTSAAKEKISVSSKATGGGAAKAVSSSSKPKNIEGLIGFSDEEIAEMSS